MQVGDRVKGGFTATGLPLTASLDRRPRRRRTVWEEGQYQIQHHSKTALYVPPPQSPHLLYRFESDSLACCPQSDDAVEVTRRQIRTLGVDGREAGRKVEGQSDWGERATSVVGTAEGVILGEDGADKARLL